METTKENVKIARAVRVIRAGLGKNMTEFAADLGVTNSSVSQWESGRIKPSTPTLLKLLQMPGGGQEKRVIINALGMETDIEAQEAIKLVKKQIENAITEARRDPSKDRYHVLGWFVELWTQHSSEPRLLDYFRDALHYIDTNLSAETREKLPPGLTYTEERRAAGLKDTDPREVKFLRDMRDLYRAEDPLITAPLLDEARRTAAALRKKEQS